MPLYLLVSEPTAIGNGLSSAAHSSYEQTSTGVCQRDGFVVFSKNAVSLNQSPKSVAAIVARVYVSVVVVLVLDVIHIAIWNEPPTLPHRGTSQNDGTKTSSGVCETSAAW